MAAKKAINVHTEHRSIYFIALVIIVSLFLTVILTSGCAIIRPPDPKPTLVPYDVVVSTPEHQPLPNATVTIDQGLVPVAAITNDAGWARLALPNTMTGNANMNITRTDYVNYFETVVLDGKPHMAPDTENVTMSRPPPVVIIKYPSGETRLNSRVFADGDGDLPMLGATMFWLAWGYEHDLERTKRALTWLKGSKFDYVRAFAAVGHNGDPNTDSWWDRTVDPTAPNWEEIIAKSTDFVYDEFQMRVQWTIFGGLDKVPTPQDRERVVDQIINIANQRRHKVFAIEVSNEAYQNGPDLNEARRLGERIAKATGIPTSISAYQSNTDVCTAFAGAAGIDFIPYHYERDAGPDGWRSVRQPWGTPNDEACPGQLVRAVSDNEPVGPGSSVVDLSDPYKLVMSYVTALVAGNGAYVYHARPGVRGGGDWDMRRGGPAEFDQVQQAPMIQQGFINQRSSLPGSLANWTKYNTQWADAPIGGFERYIDGDLGNVLNRVYWAVNGNDLLAVVIGIKGVITGTSRVNGDFQIVDPITNQVYRSFSVNVGDKVVVENYKEGLLLKAILR